MTLSIIILNYNTRSLLLECLDSIFSKKWKNDFEVVVVDNNSSDDSVELVKKKFPQVRMIESDKNLGFSKGNNLALKSAKSNFSLILNSDTLVEEGSLDQIVEFMEKTNFGIASCKLLNKDGTLQPNAGSLPTLTPVFVWLSGLDDIPIIGALLPSFHKKSKNFYKRSQQVGWVSATAMIVKKEVLKKIGLLDENIFMYAEDTEYCLRAARQDIKVGWCEDARVTHLGGGSSQNPSFVQWKGEFEGLIYIYRKYFGLWERGLLRFLIFIFTILRAVAFFIIGRKEVSRTYGKILFSI